MCFSPTSCFSWPPVGECRIELVCINPARNCQRYYHLAIEADLFSVARVLRCWGRIGTHGPGHFHVETFESWEQAVFYVGWYYRRKRRRGYWLARTVSGGRYAAFTRH